MGCRGFQPPPLPPRFCTAVYTLKPLPCAGTAAILASVLKSEGVADDLAALVHARTGGNPLFVEELGLSLREQRIVRTRGHRAALSRPPEELRMPDSVQAIVRARIDRLPEPARHLLRLAAVIGNDFGERLIARLSGVAESATGPLRELVTRELIVERQSLPEGEYAFRHEIIREVAYHSLPNRSRKALHSEVGRAVEALYADRLSELEERLAHHFDQGECWDKAVQYLVRAAVRSRRNYAIPGALQCLERAAVIVEQHRPEIPLRLHHELAFQQGQVRGDLGHWSAAASAYRAAANIAQRAREQALRTQAMYALAFALIRAQSLGEAREVLEELEALAAHDPDTLAGVVTLQAHVAFLEERLDEALAKEERAAALIRQAPRSPHLGTALYILAAFSRWRGDYDQCLAIYEDLLPRLKEAAHIQTYLGCTFFYGLALGEQGRYQDAISVLEEGLELGRKSGERYMMPKLTNSLGWVYRELGQYDRAIQYSMKALAAGRDLAGPGAPSFSEVVCQSLIDLGEAYLGLGDLPAARHHLESAHENAYHQQYAFCRPRWLPRSLLDLGQYWLTVGEPARSQEMLDELRRHAVTDRFAFRKYQLRAAGLQGLVLAAAGREQEAGAALDRALELAVALHNPGELWRTHATLARFHQARNCPQLASRHYREARRIVEGIAAGLTDTNLRDAFLGSAVVRELSTGFPVA